MQYMQTTATSLWRLINRRSRNGQAILIVAFAFIALVAFVGIAVDVALLFVRYNALSRAVDAAAIAAAGQIREGTDFRTLQAVAQQYIKLQGNIDVRTVRVETCETEIEDLRRKIYGTGSPPANWNPIAILVDGNHPQNYLKRPSELCKIDPQKLVRVSAQTASPTTFLSIIGWYNVLLEASSVSQTAVLDVALVIDSSLSQSYDTFNMQATYPVSAPDYHNGPALRAFRPFMDLNDDNIDDLGAYTTDADNNGLDDSNGSKIIRRECWENTSVQRPRSPSAPFVYASNYAWGQCCNDPATQTNPPATDPPGVTIDRLNWYIFDDGLVDKAIIRTDGNGIFSGPGAKPWAQVTSGGADGNFSDLRCEPFKQVRDAARRFIKRLDFVRGDRLYLVTFNAETQVYRPIVDDVGTLATLPVITDKASAIRTLNRSVGMSVNPNRRQSGCLTFDRAKNVNFKNVWNYWTVSQCTDTNMGGGILQARALLVNPDYVRREAVWVMVMLSDGFPNRTPSFEQLGGSGSTPHNWLAVPTGATVSGPGTWRPTNMADLTAYCRNPDVYPTTPEIEPPEWSLIAGTQPQYCVPPNGWTESEPWGLFTSSPSGPQYRASFGFCPWKTFCNRDPLKEAGSGPIQPECVDNDTQPPWWDVENPSRPWTGEPAYPYCVDYNPDTRNFCTDAQGSFNIGATGVCSPSYDPDDFARDQADAAGLIDYTDQTKGNFIAMFTIFFAHADAGQTAANTPVNTNILGVKMLRYMSDAGDNGLIDNHLQAWYRKTRGTVDPAVAGIYNPLTRQFVPDGHPAFGADIIGKPSDQCSNFDYRNFGYPQPGTPGYENLAKSDCGQFWYADSIKKVNEAFTDIAGRLFTRLSR